MAYYILTRVAQAIVTLLLLSLAVFALARASGDPTLLLLPPTATESDFARLRHDLGLDQPLYAQYATFLSNAAHGDFGESIVYRRPVFDLVSLRLPNSMQLATASLLLSMAMAFPLGILSAIKKGRPIDTLSRIAAMLNMSLPSFWVGLILVQIISTQLRWLPAGGADGLAYYILPAFALSGPTMAGIMRLLRSSMLEALGNDFITFARVKGVPEREIVLRHALKNALLPVVSYIGMYFALMVTHAIVIEVVFAWPGVGRLAYEAINFRDYPVIQGIVLMTGAMVIGVNFAVDLLYGWIDPRVR